MSTPFLTVVIASRHEAKLAELGTLLSNQAVRFVPLSEVLRLESSHDGAATLEESAIGKARGACLATGLVALAEQGGLEVDALGGRPGVRSARYAHERATDAENNAALLRDLEDVEEGERTARLRCVLALAVPWEKEPVVVEGRRLGKIARAARGHGGFGYDPLFVVDGTSDRALAELTPEELATVSPRVQAARALVPHLEALLARFDDDVARVVGREGPRTQRG